MTFAAALLSLLSFLAPPAATDVPQVKQVFGEYTFIHTAEVTLDVVDLDRDGVLEQDEWIDLGGGYLRLGAPGEWRLELGEDAVTYRVLEEGRKVPVAIEVNEWTEERFLELTEAELRELRGVEIEEWSDEIAAQVAKLDPSGCCISVSKPYVVRLPRETQHLILDQEYSLELLLQGGKSLEVLQVWYGVRKFYGSELAGFDRLRHLDLGSVTNDSFEPIGDLPALKHLDLSHAAELEDLSFVRSLTSLEFLDVKRCDRLTDLGPIGGHPSLQVVLADGSPITRLPKESLPKLTLASFLATGVAGESVDVFRGANPSASIYTEWAPRLLDAIRDADRILVGYEWDDESPGFGARVIESTEVDRVVELIEVDGNSSGGFAFSLSDPQLRFYSKGRLIAQLGLRSYGRIVWHDGLPGDLALTPRSMDRLCMWLAEIGVPGPLGDRNEQRRFDESRQHMEVEFLKELPPRFRVSVEALREEPYRGPESARSRITALDTSSEGELACARGALRALANLPEPSRIDMVGAVTYHWLVSVDQEVFSSAIAAERTNFSAMRSAVDLVFGRDHASRLRESDRDELLAVLAEIALWHQDLRLEMAAFEVLGRYRGPAVDALLLSMFRGGFPARDSQIDRENERGLGRRFTFPAREDLARICLAARGNVSFVEEWTRELERLGPGLSRMSLEVAVAMTGRPGLLTPEHLCVSEALQAWCLEAIRRFDGGYHLDTVCETLAMDEPDQGKPYDWILAEFVWDLIGETERARIGGGAQRRSREEILVWFEERGEAFQRERRAR